MTDERVLVIGATGTVGSEVVRALCDKNTDVIVRAAVRDLDAARAHGDEIEYARFDFTKLETWGGAFDGATRLFLMLPPSGVGIDRVTDAADAAVRMGVDHIVHLSELGTEKFPLLPNRRIERHLQRANVNGTFLRASFFMQNFLDINRHAIVERDEIFVPAGHG